MHSGNLAKLFGGKTVLLLNMTALLFACFLVAATRWTGVQAYGRVQQIDADLWLQMFIPVVAMLVIRSPVFSSIWVSIYAFVSVAPARWVWATLAGEPTWYRHREIVGLFIGLSAVCLAIYSVAKAASLLYDLVKRRENHGPAGPDQRPRLLRYGLALTQVGVLVALPTIFPALLGLQVGAGAYLFCAVVFSVSAALIPLGLFFALVGWFANARRVAQ